MQSDFSLPKVIFTKQMIRGNETFYCILLLNLFVDATIIKLYVKLNERFVRAGTEQPVMHVIDLQAFGMVVFPVLTAINTSICNGTMKYYRKQ